MTPEHNDFLEHSEYVEPNQPELITERLTLRHLREADIPDIVESCRDEETLRYTRIPLNYTRADAEDYLLTTIRQIAAGQIQRWTPPACLPEPLNCAWLTVPPKAPELAPNWAITQLRRRAERAI